MSKSAMNLQDSFLNQVRRENAEVRVLLVNGTMLRGNVKGFDNFTLVLNSRNGQHLIYKHAIAQLLSQRSSGSRPHGEEQGHTTEDSSSEAHTTEETAHVEGSADSPGETAAPATPAQAQQPYQQRGPNPNRGNREPRKEQREKKSGFNTLDLSNVKIEGKE